MRKVTPWLRSREETYAHNVNQGLGPRREWEHMDDQRDDVFVDEEDTAGHAAPNDNEIVEDDTEGHGASPQDNETVEDKD